MNLSEGSLIYIYTFNNKPSCIPFISLLLMSRSSLTKSRLLHISDLPSIQRYSSIDINLLLPIHYDSLKENVLTMIHYER
jgi:hypothetical protein